MIKFRAWDKAHEVMRNVLLIDFISRSIICETEDDRNIKLYDTTYELIQSTGLKDKNGVEIYEGDIVEILDIKDKYINSGIVKKGKGFFFIENYEGNKITLLSDFYLKSYTNTLELCVVGNIYK